MRVLLAAFAALIVSAAASLPAGAYTVRADHPRLLLNEEMLPMLRQRCTTTHAAIFTRMKALVDRRISEGRKDVRYLDDYAFVYLMTQQTSYADWAVSSLLQAAANHQETDGEGSAPGRLSATALAYDWLYDYMTPAQRTTVGNAFVWALENTMPLVGDRQPWLPVDEYYFYALAVYGDGIADATAAQGFDNSYRRYTTRYVPAMDEVVTGGCIDGYGGVRTEIMFVYAWNLKIALGEDWTHACSFLRNSGDYWLFRLRADSYFMRNPGKHNLAQSNRPVLFSYLASEYDNPYWQAQANRFVADTSAWDELLAYQLILWWDPGAPTDPNPPYLSYHDTGSGMTYMRSGWNFANGSRDVTVGFFNGPDLVHNFTQNHFQITRGKDELILDSGKRFSDEDLHYLPFYTHAIAHNTVTIDNPSHGNWGSFTTHDGHTYTISYNGKQDESDEQEGLRRYPRAEGVYGYRGEITDFRDDGDRVYVRGDATYAYRSVSNRVIRDFVYVRPDVFVIRDIVHRNNANWKTRTVWHVVERPVVTGNWTTLRGNWATGGVFENATTRSALVTRGNSQVEIFCLKPDANGGSMRLIGGGNAQGKPWKQDWAPQYPLTYDPSTSYEFWLDDKNWVSCSQYCQQSDIDGRNSTPLGDDAGDWRMEFEAPAGSTNLEFVTALRVAEIGTSPTPVTFNETDSGCSVQVIRAPGDTVKVAFLKDGESSGAY